MFLLDTNVISELRKPTTKIDPSVADWVRPLRPDELHVSVVTLFELELGVQRLERRDAGQGQRLRHWLDNQVSKQFARRTLVLDAEMVKTAAGLHVPDPRPERDAFIAATALVRGLTVATRNTADFEKFGVPIVNPWITSARSR